jgi:hypothetical protein
MHRAVHSCARANIRCSSKYLRRVAARGRRPSRIGRARPGAQRAGTGSHGRIQAGFAWFLRVFTHSVGTRSCAPRCRFTPQRPSCRACDGVAAGAVQCGSHEGPRLLPPCWIPSLCDDRKIAIFPGPNRRFPVGTSPATQRRVTALAPRPSPECTSALATARGRRWGTAGAYVVAPPRVGPLGERRGGSQNDEPAPTLRLRRRGGRR